MKWITPDEFNKLILRLKATGQEYEVQPSETRVNLLVRRGYYKAKFSVDLVTGEAKKNLPIASIAANFKKIVPMIESGYGRKEESSPTFDLEGHTTISWDYLDPGNYSYTNDRYRLKWKKCWSYDLNSAYSRAMKEPMPDTSKPKFDCVVGPGEIGFRKNTTKAYIAKEGHMADVVFPLMESPYKDFVDNKYKAKASKKGTDSYALAKAWLNIPSGLLHRYNIFHRLMTLYHAQKYIMQFIDEDTVYCNVDSIVSLRPRDDLPIGEGLGEFKVEHEGDMFKFKQVAIYQWGDEVHYSGIPSKAIKDIEDAKSLRQFAKYTFDGERIWQIGKDM